MNISVILPYANPHVLDWVLQLKNIGISLNIGCVKSTQDFRPGYFQEYDDISDIKYFYKSKGCRRDFERNLNKSDILISLGIFDKELVLLRRFCKSNVRLLILSEPFNPINSKRELFLRKAWSLLLRQLYHNINFYCIGGSDVKKYYYDDLLFRKSVYYNFGYFPQVRFTDPIYKMKGETLIIGYLGQLIYRKGVDKLLILIDQLKNRPNLDFEFLIAGDGSMKKKIIDEIRGDNRFKYIGLISERTNVESFLEGIDILLVPSHFDGWGAVVNEGVAKCCAIVSNYNVYAYRFISGLLGEKSENQCDVVEVTIELINNVDKLNDLKEKMYSIHKCIDPISVAQEFAKSLNLNYKSKVFTIL